MIKSCYKLGEEEKRNIPKSARIQYLLKNGDPKFTDITIRENIEDENNSNSMPVILSDKSQNIAFVIKKNMYNELYDCYDVQKKLLKEIFICRICHDTQN